MHTFCTAKVVSDLRCKCHRVPVFFSLFHQVVRAELPKDAAQTALASGEAEFQLLWILSMSCFAFDIIGHLGAFSIMSNKLNLWQAVFHGLGAFLTSWFIMYSWPYKRYWLIWGFTHLFPALNELYYIWDSRHQMK